MSLPSSVRSAVVVGAGVGGLCAAARLAAAGVAVTLVERHHTPGGRWSSREVDGFLLPTGAFLIAMDDPLAATFAELEVDFPVRAITERTVFRVGDTLVGTGERGGLRALVDAAAAGDGSDAAAVFAAVRAGLRGDTGEDGLAGPLPGWLQARGAGPQVVGALHALVQAFMGVNAKEVTATAFFEYLRLTAGRGAHGIPVEGSRRLARNLAAAVEARGGRVLLEHDVNAIVARDGRVVGVQLGDGDVLAADVVVSDVGVNTTRRLLDEPLREALPAPGADSTISAPGATCFVALTTPPYDHPAVVVTGTRRACLVTTPTLVAPELAPAGWHYCEVISTFADSTDISDVAGERRMLWEDVDDLLPGWQRDGGRKLLTMVYKGDWPVYRAWPGHDHDDRFPVPGLVLVGDSVKPNGWPGTGASAESARQAVAGIAEGRHHG